MTAMDYSRLKAYARIDGALVALTWTASFGFYVAGMATPALMLVALLIGVVSLFITGKRLCLYRDGVCDGLLSFRRGYLYAALTFLYAALLFAVAQFAYLQFLDNGFFASSLMAMTSKPDMKQAIKASGMEQAFNEAVNTMLTVRPIDYALNYFTTNILLGLILALPIAGVASRSQAKA